MFRVNFIDEQQHRHFLLQGSHQALAELMQQMGGSGVAIGVSPPDGNESLPLVFVPESAQESFPSGMGSWLVWNRNDLAMVQTLAQERGALCVLPSQLTPLALSNALQNADVVGTRNGKVYQSGALKRHFEKGGQIHLEEDRVVRIRRGVVRCCSYHPDGTEVLIGFYGPGDVLMAHASYSCQTHSCHVEMRAHTALVVEIEPWSLAITRADFSDRLKQRICQMELWSSMQARPNMEDRLWGILQVVGGRFSHPSQEGTILDIKLTHDQLAGAIGATRTTVTRLLGSLRNKGLLGTTKTPAGEFFVLSSKLKQCSH